MLANRMAPATTQRQQWLLLGLALLVLAAVISYDRYAAYQTLIGQEGARLVKEAAIVQENLGRRLQTTSNALAKIREELPWLLDQAEGLAYLNRRLSTLVAASTGIRTFLVVNLAGEGVASNRPELIGMTFRDQARYQTIRQGGDANTLYISSPFTTPLGIWALGLGRMLADDQGQFNGYILAITDPDYFRLLLNSIRYAPDMQVDLIHGDGQYILRVPDAEGPTAHPPLREQAQAAFRAFRASGEASQLRAGTLTAPGAVGLTVWQNIWPETSPADQPLVVAISRDRAAYLAPWRQEAVARVVLFLVIAGVAGLGLIASQRRQRDLDRLQVAEAARRALLEERLRLATDGAELGLWFWDIPTDHFEGSDRCQRLLGLPPGQEPNRAAFAAAPHPDDRAGVEQLLHEAMTRRAEYAAEYRVCWPDGSLHWIRAQGRVYPAADGGLQGMGGVVFDITARRQAEQNLRDSEQRFRQLFEHLPIAYQALDSAGRWLDANQPLADLLGFAQPADLLGLNFRDLWAGVKSEQGATPDDLCQAAPLLEGELPLRRRDGQPLRVQIAGRIQRDAAGQFLRIHCILVDITARHAMEAEIRRLNADLEAKVEARTREARAANAAKSEFLAHMSHEIRTPMNAMLGLAQLLNHESLNASQQAMVQRLQRAGQSLVGILNDILDFSKIEAGQLRLTERPFALEQLTAELESLLSAVARDKQLALHSLVPSPSLGTLRGDDLRLMQVLMNLTGNAIKFTEQGAVTLRIQPRALTAAAVRLRFEIQDTGIGIDPTALAGLFTPFTQADGGITRRYGGTGLGLAISKRLVELMGGQIGATSQPGQGSTFWFEIPCTRVTDADGEAPALPLAKVITGPRLTGLRILAVDDNALNLDLLERVLTREGARVTLAADGQQALQALQREPCDAVLMDVQMPVMDGLTAMRRIRGDLGLQALPMLALTGNVLAEQQQAALRAGADEVLTKPLDLEHLIATLRRRMGEPALAAATSGPGAAVAPVAVAEAATAFPEIAGIDRARVTLICGDDPAFFLKLLAGFLRDAAPVVAQIRQALRQDDRDGAAGWLHNLKGNAGNLGALALMQAASRLEQDVSAGHPDGSPGVDDLDRQLQALTQASAPWLRAPARAQASAPGVAAPPDPAQVGALRDALRRHNLGALELFEPLAASLTLAGGDEAVQALGQAIDELRFAAALAQLDDLCPPTSDVITLTD